MYAWRAESHGAAAPASEAELADDYLRNFDRTKNASFVEKQAYRFRLLPDGDYVRLTCFSIDLGGIKGRIKPEGFTVNDYLAAALFLAIALGVQIPKGAPDVSLSIPINLRPFFGSVTQRNFSYYVNVRIPVVADMEQAAALHTSAGAGGDATRPAALRHRRHGENGQSYFYPLYAACGEGIHDPPGLPCDCGHRDDDNAIESWISEAGARWWKRSSTVLRCILVRAEAG